MLALAGAAEPADKPARPIFFDIPAQSLETALDAYGAVSRVQVLYETQVTAGRRSTAVKGTYAPETALGILLSGSGLDFDDTEERAFTLVPAKPAAPAPLLRAAPRIADFDHFLGGLQAGILAAMCAHPEARPGKFRMAVQLRIGASGMIEQAVLLSSTGNRARDAAIVGLLRHLSFDEGAPTSMPQPVTMVLLPDDGEDCASAGN